MKIELWSEGKLFQTTRFDLFDEGDEQLCLAASEKIAHAARKHGITLWFD